MRGSSLAAAVAAWCVLAAHAGGATTWFVPGGQPNVAAAIAAAADGDTIQLAPGYIESTPFSLGAKSITIRGDAANPALYTIAPTAPSPPVCVSHLAPGKKVVLTGVSLVGTNSYDFNGGQVELSNCRIAAAAGMNAPAIHASSVHLVVAAVTVESTGTDAAAHLFTVVGGAATFAQVKATAGSRNLLDASGATVALDACEIKGVGGMGSVVRAVGGSVAIDETVFSETLGGAALDCSSAEVALTHVLFSGIGSGGAEDGAYPLAIVGAIGSPCALTSCTFVANGNGKSDATAGVGTVDARPFALDGCRFEGNADADSTGALRLAGAGTVTACEFLGNASTSGPGGALTVAGDVALVGCRFEQNASPIGGGAVHVVGGSLSISACRFVENDCSGGADAIGGGALLVSAGASASIDTSHFAGNRAQGVGTPRPEGPGGGGAIHVAGGSVEVDRTWFVGNASTDGADAADARIGPGMGSGGAIAVSAGSATLTRATLVSNTADTVGGAVAVHGGDCTLDSSIVAGNSAGGGASPGGGAYLAPGAVGIASASRVCGNAPDSVAGAWDIDGETELACETLHYPGAAPSIQATIDAAGATDVVLIAEGIYHEAFDLSGKSLAVLSHGGPSTAIIDGTGVTGSLCRAVSGETPSAIVHGIAFRNGVSGSPHGRGMTAGGAVYCVGASPTFSDCRFDANAADVGGAAFGSASYGTFDGCTFNGNAANVDGGALHWEWGGGSAIGCEFLANAAGRNGGAVHVLEGESRLDGCTIEGNVAEHFGGGVACTYEPPEPGPATTLTGCQLSLNTAGLGGGGLYASSGNAPVHVLLTTVCGNAPDDAIGPYLSGPGSVVCGCPSDLDVNGATDAGDLAVLLGSWGPCANCAADLNGDGTVAATDLGLLLGAWGACDD